MHTDSSGYGTNERCCHQDWILGDCGITQTAAGYNFLLCNAVPILFFIFNFVLFSVQNHWEVMDYAQYFIIILLNINLWQLKKVEHAISH